MTFLSGFCLKANPSIFWTIDPLICRHYVIVYFKAQEKCTANVYSSITNYKQISVLT